MLINVKTRTGGNMISRLNHGAKDKGLLVGASGVSAFKLLVFIGFSFLLWRGVRGCATEPTYALFDAKFSCLFCENE